MWSKRDLHQVQGGHFAGVVVGIATRYRVVAGGRGFPHDKLPRGQNINHLVYDRKGSKKFYRC